MMVSWDLAIEDLGVEKKVLVGNYTCHKSPRRSAVLVTIEESGVVLQFHLAILPVELVL